MQTQQIMQTQQMMQTQELPLPNRQVLIKLLGLYTRYDLKREVKEVNEAEQASLVSTMWHLVTAVGKQVVEAAQTVLTGSSPSEIINTLCNEALRQIKNTSDFESWYTLVLSLREKGKAGQSLKTKEGQSRSCEIFNAMASYIIEVIEKHPQFIEKVAALEDDVKRLEEDISKCISVTKNGEQKDKLETKYAETVLSLAYLENSYGNIHANRNGSLKYLLKLEERQKQANHQLILPVRYNPAVNHCLQKSFHQMLYAYRYQKRELKSYDDFMKASPNPAALFQQNNNAATLAKSTTALETHSQDKGQPRTNLSLSQSF